MANEVRWSGQVTVNNAQYAKVAGRQAQSADQSVQGDVAGIFDLTATEVDLDALLAGLTTPGVALVENLSLLVDGPGDAVIRSGILSILRLKPEEKFVFRFVQSPINMNAIAVGGDVTSRFQITVWED